MSKAGGSRFQRQPRARTLADPEADQAVREIREHLDELRGVEGMDSRFLERVDPNDKASKHISLTPGSIVKIPHGLGRPFRGFEKADVIADGATAAGEIVRVTTDGSGNVCDESREIWLKALTYTGATTVKVRIKVY